MKKCKYCENWFVWLKYRRLDDGSLETVCPICILEEEE